VLDYLFPEGNPGVREGVVFAAWIFSFATLFALSVPGILVIVALTSSRSRFLGDLPMGILFSLAMMAFGWFGYASYGYKAYRVRWDLVSRKVSCRPVFFGEKLEASFGYCEITAGERSETQLNSNWLLDDPGYALSSSHEAPVPVVWLRLPGAAPIVLARSYSSDGAMRLAHLASELREMIAAPPPTRS
jgi:hypothetical protein